MNRRIERETINTGQKYGTEEEGAARYRYGTATFKKLAKEAGGDIHFGSTVRYNFEIIDKYFDSLGSHGARTDEA